MVLNCAHRAIMASLSILEGGVDGLPLRALCEYRRSSGSIPSSVPGAQDQRGCPSNPFYRARSASKKGGPPTPCREAARCASTWSGEGPVDSLSAALLDFSIQL